MPDDQPDIPVSWRYGRWVGLVLVLALAVWFAWTPLTWTAFRVFGPSPTQLTLDDVESAPASHTAISFDDKSLSKEDRQRLALVDSRIPRGWRLAAKGSVAEHGSAKSYVGFAVQPVSAGVDASDPTSRKRAAVVTAQRIYWTSDYRAFDAVGRTAAGHPAIEVVVHDRYEPNYMVIVVFLGDLYVIVDCHGVDDTNLAGCATIANHIRVRDA